MAIVTTVAIHPNQGVTWDELQKPLKKILDLARKHGAENVTALYSTVGGAATNTIAVLASAENWTKYGQAQQALWDDPKLQALMGEAAKLSTWETYVLQTIPDM